MSRGIVVSVAVFLLLLLSLSRGNDDERETSASPPLVSSDVIGTATATTTTTSLANSESNSESNSSITSSSSTSASSSSSSTLVSSTSTATSSSNSTSNSSDSNSTTHSLDPADEATLKYLDEALASLTNNDVHDLLNQIEELELQQAQLLDNVKQVEKLVHEINQRQLHAIILKLTEIENYELARREDQQQQQQQDEFLMSRNSSGGIVINASDVNVTDYIPTEELETMFNVTEVLEETDVALESWIRNVLEDQVQKAIEPLFFSNSTQIQIVEDPPEQVVEDGAENDYNETLEDIQRRCVSPKVVAIQVQQAVVNYSQDGIGLFDHAHKAAVIVHELTSNTYQPTGYWEEEQKDLDYESDDRASNTLRFVWWSRFIPEDWETLLPEGWKDWSGVIPTFLSHTLGARFKANVAPPEAIIDSSTVPGSCWPMQGSSGRVTLRLPYPVKVTAVSIDHASALLLTNRLEQIKSAPKKVIVYGFPPCSTTCDGLGFDVKRKMLLKTLEYDAERGGVQTFQIGPVAAVGKESESCEALSSLTSSSSSACTAPIMMKDDPMVMGIEVNIQENWGKSEYTCLYRIRVHGDHVLAR